MNKSIFVVLTIFCWLNFDVIRPVIAEEVPVSITPPAANWGWSETSAAPSGLAGESVLEAVRYVREWLQKEVDNQTLQPGYEPPLVNSRHVPVEIVAALWNEHLHEFALVRVLKNGATLKQIGADTYQFRLVRDNGVNSLIKVTNRPDLIVLGLIYPVFKEIKVGPVTRYQMNNVVYIPYSDKLRVAAVVQAGEEYLNGKIKAVYNELDRLGIKSFAFPENQITEVINPSIVKTILAIEHVDATVLINDSADAYLEKFFATLAANKHSSYAYAKSSASARGLVQFIPATYASLRRLRPELTLHADFVQGMTDPYNAIKAQIALLDYNLSLLPAHVKNKYLNDHFELGSYLAAMYNGGPARVRRAIASWGQAWDKYHGNVWSSLRRETAYYVTKYRLIFNKFADDSVRLAVNEPTPKH